MKTTAELKKWAEQFLDSLPHHQALLPWLIAMTIREEGSVNEDLQPILAEICGVPVERVKETIQAYHLSLTEAEGSLQICGDLVCALNGGQEIILSLEAPDPNRPPFTIISCPGFCYAAPVVLTATGACTAILSNVSRQPLLAEPGDSACEQQSIERNCENILE
jgi:NADH:ubiquinone oxidoreductase subunit E